MASYRNSAGNKGITAEYGQWRYFNASIRQLGEYRAARLNSRILQSGRKDADDIQGLLTDTTKNVSELYGAVKSESYKLADEYIDKYGLQAWNKVMVDNNVPIQYNPLAMQRLKYRTGQIISGIENVDFANRIDRGEFVGKSPIELEAAMLESKSKTASEVAEVLPFTTQDDYYFNQGYWGGSQKQRATLNARNAEVTNDRYVDQAVRDISSAISEQIDRGATPEELKFTVQDLQDSYGIYLSNKDVDSIYKSAFAKAATKPYGRSYIESLADSKMFRSDLTVRDYFGNNYIEKLIVDADNEKFKADAREMYSFKSKLTSLESSPDGIAELKSMLSDELKVNGNKETYKTNLIYASIEQAERNAKTNLEQSKKEADKAVRMASQVDYYRSVVSGKSGGVTEESKIYEWGNSTANERKLSQQAVVNEVFASGDPIKIDTMLTEISKNGSPTELRTYTASILKNMWTDTYKAVSTYVEKGSLPTVAEGAVPYQREDGAVLGYVPQSLYSFIQLYNLNPSAVANLVNEDKDFKGDMDIANMAIDMGMNPIEVLARRAKFDDDINTQSKATGAPKRTFHTAIRAKEIYGLDVDSISQSKLADLNDTMSGIVKNLAIKYNTLNPDATLGKSVESAKRLVEGELAGVHTVVMPKSILFSGFSGITLSDSSKEDIIDIANGTFERMAKQFPNVKDKKDYDLSFYDPQRNEIRVIGLDAQIRGIIPISYFTKGVREDFDKGKR